MPSIDEIYPDLLSIDTSGVVTRDDCELYIAVSVDPLFFRIFDAIHTAAMFREWEETT